MEILKNTRFTNVTRPQLVEVIEVKRNYVGHQLVTYKVIIPTTDNPITEFTVLGQRFMNVYQAENEN